jgi:uncharacterized damage-inducible protein DinB
MTNYGGRELAEAFKTVRENTIAIAEDIPADNYSFRPAPESRSVAELLAHLATGPMWQVDVHSQHIDAMTFEMFSKGMAAAAAVEQSLNTKDALLKALKENGDRFAAFLQGITAETLSETVSFPPPLQPAKKTRFEMLLSAKEHEMHHRGQLMVYERMLGIVPHLTRRRQERNAQSAAARA